jgi:glycosyltransferase involved in cell wall biosynthesis
MPERKTICLTMIVKNEGHIIAETLEHLCKFIQFDYWVISDTGSTDKTREIIQAFFKAKGIPGELQEEAWRDFGYNRTKAFEGAFGKTDYAFVWDADDEIRGDFKFPEILNADFYKFTFGNESGTRYSRPQLFNNRKRWCYKGVLHEYSNCLEPCGPAETVGGNYYFVSGRKGARNKDPQKYLKDAQILEAAAEKALAEGDELYNRYIFYCAQSYNCCNMSEKAIEFYKKALTLPIWTQEKYICCLEIYDLCEGLKKPMEGLPYLVESYKYDKERVECFYRLIKYYCINGPVEVAYSYYTLVQDFFENRYNSSDLGHKLFAKKTEYDFYFPYYMVMIGYRTKNFGVAIKMYEKIFKNAFIAPEWWVHNLIHNMRFCIDEFPLNADFLESMLAYVDMAMQKGIKFEKKHYEVIEKVVDRYRDILSAPSLAKPKGGPSKKGVKVMLTVTTCKRLDLFTKTMNSILNCWTDVEKIDYFFCVDDNSSEEDRAVMCKSYPFFEYYMKGPEERGHRESMNVIWDKLKEVQPTYWIHLEDDWLYFKREAYVTRAMETLAKYESRKVHQVVFNRTYGLMFTDMERVGGIPLDSRTILHEKRDGIVGRNCGFWPHYSLQPSMIRTRVILELGNYNSPNKFFERDYANKYFAKGYLTAFFNSIYSIHIGKQHWEKEGKNAYALNDVTQGVKHAGGQAKPKPKEDARQEKDAKWEIIGKIYKDKPFPHAGSMREHLDWFMDRILRGIPFALIRPSDGERMIMLGKTLTNCDHWTFQEGGSLQKLLLDSVKIQDPNIFIGIPCNTCNKPWNCTPAIYRDFIDKFHIPLAQRTYANIFGNSNWAPFTEFLKSYGKGFYLVSSGRQETEIMRVKGRHVISDKLVNTWDADGSAETEKVMRFVEGLREELILFSAGPLSKVWIPKCFQANPTNMYVDVGAAIDTFTKGTTARLYTNPSHPFAKESCRFQDVVHKKHLVYACVFYNRDYMKLLELLLASMKIYSSMESFDILILASPDFEQSLHELSSKTGIYIRTMFIKLSTIFEAACARLRIFDYQEISRYDTILYLDTDIIIKGDLAPLFSLAKDKVLYAIEEGTIASKNFGGGLFFRPGEIDMNTGGINSGTLLFQNCVAVRDLFSRIRLHIQVFTDKGEEIPYALDQPFINYHAIQNGIYNNKTLNPFVSLYEKTDTVTNYETSVICHFSFPIGNFGHKYKRMKTFFIKLLRNPLIHACEYENRVKGKRFTWGTGFIEFTDGENLKTGWGKGKYQIKAPYLICAFWNNYYHMLRFNEDFSECITVRIYPEDCIVGYSKIVNKL